MDWMLTQEAGSAQRKSPGRFEESLIRDFQRPDFRSGGIQDEPQERSVAVEDMAFIDQSLALKNPVDLEQVGEGDSREIVVVDVEGEIQVRQQQPFPPAGNDDRGGLLHGWAQ